MSISPSSSVRCDTLHSDRSTMTCSHRSSLLSIIQVSRAAVKNCRMGLAEEKGKFKLSHEKWYIELNVIHLNSTSLYFDIHKNSDGTSCVSTTQLICMQTWRILRMNSCFSCWVFFCLFFLILQGKTSVTWKGFNGSCLLWDVDSVCVFVHVLVLGSCVNYKCKMYLQGGNDEGLWNLYIFMFCIVTSELVSVIGTQTCTSEHNVL